MSAEDKEYLNEVKTAFLELRDEECRGMDEEASRNHMKILVQYARHAPQEHCEEWIQQTEKCKHFFDLIGDNIPQILRSPFNIIPDLAQFFIKEFISPEIKTDAEMMEGVQKQLSWKKVQAVFILLLLPGVCVCVCFRSTPCRFFQSR